MKKFLFLVLFAFLVLPAYSSSDIEYINDEAGIHIYKINIKKLGSKIKPYVAKDLMSAKELYDTGKFQLVVNGGFFDLETGEEISFVKIDGRTVNSPFNNQKLISDIKAQNRLTEVINRPEMRIFKLPLDRYKITFEPHFATNADNIFLVHSLQAGPFLAPYYKPEVEGFVKHDEFDNVIFDSVNLSKKRERTILGIRKNNLYIVLFTENSKMTGYELKEFVKKQKFEYAMALDGGDSVSAVSKDECIKANSNEMRKVKSFLVIER